MKTKFIFWLICFMLKNLLTAQETAVSKLSLFKDKYHSKNQAIKSKKPNVKNIFYKNDNRKTYSENAVLYLPLKAVHYYYDSNNWMFIDSSEFMYYTTHPNKGKLMQEIRYGNMNNRTKDFHRYNNNGYMQACTQWYGNNYDSIWYPDYRDTFYYSTSGKWTKAENQKYNSMLQDFVVMSRTERIYNFSNKLIKEIYYTNVYDYYTNTYTLTPSGQTMIYYNTSNQYTAAIFQDYNNALNTYTNSLREIYYYDNSGKINKVYTFEWNPYSNKWDTAVKYTNITWYKWLGNNIEDMCNHLLSYCDITEYYNGDKYKSFRQISYDPIDDEILDDMEAYWDNSTNQWYLSEFKYLITRNQNYGNMMVEKIEQYYETGYSGFENKHKWIYKQPSLTSVNTTVRENNETKIIPNPNHGQFKIVLPDNNCKISNVKICDIMGKVVYEQTPVFNSQQLCFDDVILNSGVYFIYIEYGDGSNARPLKMLVE